MMNTSNTRREPFPSPSEKEDLNKAIKELRLNLKNPPEDFDKNEGRLKLADLLIGRNDASDYIEASKIYDEIINTTLPGKLRCEAMIGKAELLTQSRDNEDIKIGLNLSQKSLEELSGKGDDYFETKAKLVKAELLLRRGKEWDNSEALKIYEEILSNPSTSNYFGMRALVGKIDIMEYFQPVKLEEDLVELIVNCERALEANEDRLNDYFRIKGQALLAELYIKRNSEEGVDKAKKLLNEIANNEAAGVDLRARASLDLAEISSEALARTLIREVRHMEGIDPYILKKAKVLEEKLHSK